jgi:hypothetical protein
VRDEDASLNRKAGRCGWAGDKCAAESARPQAANRHLRRRRPGVVETGPHGIALPASPLALIGRSAVLQINLEMRDVSDGSTIGIKK